MNGYDAYNLIREIADESGRNAKLELVKRFAADENGRFVLKWTYNPFITFGIKPSPSLLDLSEQSNVGFRPSLIARLLTELSTRKLTGKAAEREVSEVFAILDRPGREILFRILSKDLKAGISESTINSAVPGLIPSFAVMRAQPYDPKKVRSWPVKVEYKLDGQRNTFVCLKGSGGFYTRSGKVVPALDFLVPKILEIAEFARTQNLDLAEMLADPEMPHALSFVLDGEAMTGLFETTGALRRKDSDAEDAELHLYDIMSAADFFSDKPVATKLIQRRRLLETFVNAAHSFFEFKKIAPFLFKVPQFFAHNDDDVRRLFLKSRTTSLASYLARGDKTRQAELLKTTIDRATGRPKVLEGVMVKDQNGPYEKRKCYGWMKLKAEETEDLRVIGAFPGEPMTKYADCLGGLIVDRNGVSVRVGGGFTDVERREIWDAYQRDAKVEHWPSPGPNPEILGRLIEVEYHEVTPDGSLRHPRFVRFRDDKDGEKDAA